MKQKYSDALIVDTIKVSRSWADVCRRLRGFDDIKADLTGMQSHIKQRAIRAGADYSHFLGQAWNRGGNFPAAHTLDEYLTYHGPRIKPYDLKKKLLKAERFRPICSRCELTTWMGEAIPLELDHKNGDRFDNQIDNLRLMCPNCHTLTPTFAGKNSSKNRRNK